MLKQREQTVSRLEEKFGIKLIADPFPCLIGSGVCIATGSGHYSGVYRGMTTTGHLMLYPFVGINNSPATNGDSKKKYYWDYAAPLFVSDPMVVAVIPKDIEGINEALEISEDSNSIDYYI